MNETAGALGIIILLEVLNFMLIAVMFFRFTFIVPAIIKKEMSITKGVFICLLWLVSVVTLTLLHIFVFYDI
jgi:hypothetical protein